MRRGAHNRLGFALQLCAFRYPGRILAAGEAISLNVLGFIAAQLGMGTQGPGWLWRYGRKHAGNTWPSCDAIYGYKMFLGTLQPGT